MKVIYNQYFVLLYQSIEQWQNFLVKETKNIKYILLSMREIEIRIRQIKICLFQIS